MSLDRQLVAIMFTDIEGYTSLMQQDEDNAMRIRNKHREIFNKVTKKYHGELIQYYGDGSLSIFKSSVEAVKCSIEMQIAFQNDLPIPVRIGIHVGDIIRTESDIIGDAVNISSRIESLSVPGSVLISDKVNDQLKNHKDIETTFLDVFEFKNVEHTMPIFAVSNKGLNVPELSVIKGKTIQRESRLFKNYKRNMVFVSLVLVGIIFTILYYNKSNAINEISHDRYLAVLPFTNMNNDDNSEFFTDGFTEDILTDLSKIKDLHVISRKSTMQYKGSKKTISKIAKELGVSFVLEGSVRKYGKKVRISAQLIDAGNNEYLWAESYDKTLTEIFDIQSQVSNEIVKALKITLNENEQKNLNKKPTENEEAYRVYKEAQMFLNRGGGRVEELKKAKELFSIAIGLDSSFSSAYVGLADTYLEYIYWGRSPAIEILEKARIPALKALKLDPTSGGSYGALGSIYFYQYNRETAISYLESAIELNPSSIGSYDKLAWIHVYEGNIDQAVTLFQKVLNLDPLSTKHIGNIVLSYYYFHEYDRGFSIVNEALKKHPDDNMLLWMKANLFTAIGNYDEAIKLYNRRTDGINTNWMLGYTYGRAGNKKKALDILNFQLEKAKTVFVPPYMIATIYMGLGTTKKPWIG